MMACHPGSRHPAGIGSAASSPEASHAPGERSTAERDDGMAYLREGISVRAGSVRDA
jgi:hypothetical protein